MADPLAKVDIPATGLAGASAGHPARRYAIASVGVAALLLAGTLGLVVGTDPRAEFGSPLGLEPLVVPDPAAAKLALYEALPAPPPAVVLGSSRAMMLPPDRLAPGSFNFAVAGGGLADTVLVYGHVVRTDPALRHLVITVDVFGITEGKQVRIAASTAYDELTGQPLPERGFAWGSLPSALSAAQAEEAARVVYHSVAGYPEPAETLEADGLARRPSDDRAIAAGSHDAAAVVRAQYTPKTIGVYAGERAPADPALLADLHDMAADALARGLDVAVVLPPYHPDAYELVNARPAFGDRVASILSALQPLCGEGLGLFDYSDGSAIGSDERQFYDGHHPTAANGARILDAVARGDGDRCRAGGDANGGA